LSKAFFTSVFLTLRIESSASLIFFSVGFFSAITSNFLLSASLDFSSFLAFLALTSQSLIFLFFKASIFLTFA